MTSSLKTQVSAAGLALIRAAESFSARLYLCPAGKPTIGYGHVVRPTDRVPANLTKTQAEALMVDDLQPVVIYLNAVFPELNQNEFDALASFCFNCGIGAFEKSTLFKRLKAGDKHGAASQFARWVHGGGKVLPGLVKRRAIEARMFLQVPA
ncbi:lysozyme [Propionivibrio sp.]|uniref:lysozyme n=1 Tax=Propionivibrio sp. TaxID=2212460 RepID=UPI003BF074BA